MCGRFTLIYQQRQRLAEELGVNVEEINDADYRPRYNIAPTDPHWIVRMRYEDREILSAKWGLVNTWAKDAKRAAKHGSAKIVQEKDESLFARQKNKEDAIST